MSQDGNPAVFVGTMLTTGDAVALCDECMVPWAAALLNVMTGLDPTPFLVAVSDDVPLVDLEEPAAAAEGAGGPALEEAPPPTNGRRGRTSRASPEAGTDAGPPDAPPAPTDVVSPPAA